MVDAALDARARDTVSEQLGHGRREIANVYLGRRPTEKSPKGCHDLSDATAT
jgi:hypothetical protein